MGLADSPLRDRVIFIEGAPRSGTTLLTTLLAAHPDVAGIISESFIFDFNRGVGALFDNWEGEGAWKDHLGAYVTRDELVDLTRNLCDGVFERMRSRIAPAARFVAEKTPARRIRPEVTIARKLEIYPDAWYVHIVRDREAVVRSLMRAPWNIDRSRDSSERWSRSAVKAVRDACADHPRYIEVGYEALAADPVAEAAKLFDAVGLGYDDEILDRVGHVSKERFSGFGPRTDEEEPAPPRERDGTRNGAAVPSLAKRALDGLRRSPVARPARRALAYTGARRALEKLATQFGEAMRAADPARLEPLTDDSLVFVLRSPDGDLRAEGAEARAAIASVSERIFGDQYFALSWTVATGKPFVSLLFSGMHKDGTRVDLSLGLFVRRGKIVRVAMISAGSLDGRPLGNSRDGEDLPSALASAG